MSNEYGEWIRKRREEMGLTQDDLGTQAFMSRTHIAHIEAGRRVPMDPDARRLDQVLDAKRAVTHFRPKARPFEGPDYFAIALELEQQATEIHVYAHTYVAGVLQTEDYARECLRSYYPAYPEDRLAELTAKRVARAQLLDDPATPTYWALIEEAALRRPPGSPGVMARQVDRIVELAESDRIRLNVLPAETPLHALSQGLLSLMWFEDQPEAAYTEALAIGYLHEEPRHIRHLQNAYALVLGEALPQAASLALAKSAAREWGPHARR